MRKVQVLFAHLKRILKLDRLRLRGRSGAQDEFLLAATAQKPQANGEVVSARSTPNGSNGNLKRAQIAKSGCDKAAHRKNAPCQTLKPDPAPS
jgi:hypothetical protein